MDDVRVSLGETPNNESAVKTNSAEYNIGTRRKQLIHEEHNSAYNHHTIVKALEEGRARDLREEPRMNGEPAFILGSGPSLDNSIEYLKDWEGGIICTTSHALTLMYHGIKPSHIVVLDPFCQWSEIEGIDWSKTRTKLVTHPGVWPDLLEHWPNDILLYRQNLGRREPFYSGTQKRMYTRREGFRDATFHFLIRTELTIFACSPPAQLFVADILGYKRIYLAGVDFCFSEDKERFTGYTIKKPGYTIQNTTIGKPIEIPPEWEKHEYPFEKKERHLLMDNGMYSEKVHLYYKKNFLSAIRLSMQEVYTTDHGAITELPYVDVAKAVKTQGKTPSKRTPSKALQAQRIEKYLAYVGAYIIETSKGLSFVESPDPLKDLPDYMRRVMRNYICPNCGATAISHDDEDHTDTQCAQCGHKGMDHEAIVDIDSNMKRIKKLIQS